MSTFNYKVDSGAQKTTSPKVRKAQFGDGYMQRVGDGINNINIAWDVSFTADAATIAAIVSFLTTAAGVDSFDWTSPDGVAGKYVCESWSKPFPSKKVQTITAQFKLVYGE